MVERETLIEAGVAILVTLGFIGLVVGLGVSYGSDGLSGEGAFGIVAAIGLFVVVMAGAGYWLSSME